MSQALNSYWEYKMARRTLNMLSDSESDTAYYYELEKQIEDYEREPTKPNIIEHTKGNV